MGEGDLSLGKAGYYGNHSAPLTSTVLTRWWQLSSTLPGLFTLSIPADCTPGQHRWAPASLPQTHLLLQVCPPASLGGRKSGKRTHGETEEWNPCGIKVMVECRGVIAFQRMLERGFLHEDGRID